MGETTTYTDEYTEWVTQRSSLKAPAEMPYSFNPDMEAFYAQHKLLLVNGDDPAERAEALFNPEELSIRLQVTTGRLHPVGWSHPIKQYSYTNEASFALRLMFTHLAMGTVGPPISRKVKSPMETGEPDIRKPVNWLASFCYAFDPGGAPPPLIVIWPKTLTMAVTVDNFVARYTKWAAKGQPTACLVELAVSEIRQAFRSRGDQAVHGWEISDEGHGVNGLGQGFRTSQSSGLRMGGSGVR